MMMVLALDPQSTGKRVTSLGHTIQIVSKPSFFFFFFLQISVLFSLV